jgi:hypothetical protein
MALCILLTGARSALGQDEHDTQTAQPQTPLVLLLVSAAGNENALARMLGERLNELHVETLTQTANTGSSEATIQQAKSSAQRTHAAIVLWFSLLGDTPQLYIYDTEGDRTTVRRLPEVQADAAAREEWLIIASTTVSALLEGQHETSAASVAATDTRAKTTPNDAAPKPAPKPTAPSSGPQPAEQNAPSARTALPAAPDSSIELLLGYFGTSTLAEGGRWQNGASGSLLLWLPRHLHVGAAYALLPAQTIAVGENQIEIGRQPVSLAFGLDARAPWRHWQWLLADLSLSVDRVNRTTQAPEAVLVGTPAASRWLWDVGARAGAAVSLVSNVSLYGLLGARLGVSGFDYVALGEQGEERTHIGQRTAQVELGLCVNVF